MLNILIIECMNNITFSDNLVIVSGLGIQLTTAYLISSKKIFIPIEKIQEIFINEVLHKVNLI